MLSISIHCANHTIYRYIHYIQYIRHTNLCRPTLDFFHFFIQYTYNLYWYHLLCALFTFSIILYYYFIRNNFYTFFNQNRIDVGTYELYYIKRFALSDSKGFYLLSTNQILLICYITSKYTFFKTFNDILAISKIFL